MHDFEFAASIQSLPQPADAERVALGHAHWDEACEKIEDPTEAALARDALQHNGAKAILESLFGNSPYLTRSAAADPVFTSTVLEAGPDAAFDAIMADLAQLRRNDLEALNEDAIVRGLRVAKCRAALTIAIADITQAWPLARVTGSLSTFADTALSIAAAHCLATAAASGGIELAHADDPERESGLVILAMGKLGSHELNYSSDIDLIVLFDAEKVRTENPDGLGKQFVRITRHIVRLMDDRTADGYVFRTDLRLRPDPGSMPIAVSVRGAEAYYETVGQNWERAAMIKARPCAGDLAAGQDFMDFLRPFIWRKNLDFAAIQDIHSIKRQINAHRGGSGIQAEGHDVKLGRGGIREIEFFAQTQQLIWGGRDPDLRIPGTQAALAVLADKGHVSPETANDMDAAYQYLRQLEHRLQMIDDEQTHTLPNDKTGLGRVALFMGYDGLEAFTSGLLSRLKLVESHYAQLFEDSPELAARDDAGIGGNLVFTGGDTDPDTLKTIVTLGYSDGQKIDATVRGWHHGRIRATRSPRAREILTELMPTLLKAFAETPNPDAAFQKFDEFLSRLPSGVQLFSMFHSNPNLLDLVAEVVGCAPRMADHLSHNPAVLDSVLTDGFFDSPPGYDDLTDEVERMLGQARDYQDELDIFRRWANDRKFQVGIQTLRGSIAPKEAATARSNIAEVALASLLPRVEAEYASNHGRIPGGQFVVLGFGKLGGREMTAESDLDLTFIYEAPGGGADPDTQSDGDRPLGPSQYYARLAQRFINAVNAPTGEGSLFEVDMRLRPSGASGPIASTLESFGRYYREQAWTWEYMALTRARPVAGSQALRQQVSAAVSDILKTPRDADALVRNVADMRRRLARERSIDFIWDVKHIRGGLVDIEFMVQFLELKYAASHPDVLHANTGRALTALIDAGLPESPELAALVEPLALWQFLQGLLRLTIDRTARHNRDHDIPEDLQKRLADRAGVADFEALTDTMAAHRKTVLGLFEALVDTPAGEQDTPI